MIRGIHGLLYSSDPEATRAFFRNKVRLPGSDIGDGWWIFDFAEGDLGVHPIDRGGTAGAHDVSFYCDDLAGTVAAMEARGVTFTSPITDRGYGLVTYLEAPGGITIQLYEPRYTKGAAITKRPSPKATSKKPAPKAITKKPSPKAKRPAPKAATKR